MLMCLKALLTAPFRSLNVLAVIGAYEWKKKVRSLPFKDQAQTALSKDPVRTAL